MKVVVIGSGPGGYVCALKLAHLGASVTVIEEHEVGGTCLNWGCIPTKAMVASAEAFHKAKNLQEFGIELTGTVVANLSKILERKNKVISTMVKGIRALFKSAKVELIEGRGRLTSTNTVAVTKKDGSTETITADNIVIATGSRPAEIPTFRFDGKFIISSTEALALTELPKHLIIIGAGVIGCEFACIFSELGCEVTMIELMPRAVSTEDPEISEILQKELKKRKIKLLTSVKVTSAEVKDNQVSVALDSGNTITGDKLLVSIGRAFNSDNLGLEDVGVAKGQRGEILVNEYMQTNIPNIYAIGDVTGGILLAHVASAEGLVTASNIMGKPEKIDYSVVPAAIFTMPEIGSVGIREHQAMQKGIDVKIGRFPFRGLGKAHAMGEIAGMVKVIARADDDKIIGMHIIGPHAADLIHEGAVAIKAGMTAKELGHTIHSHPTLAEAIMEAAEDVHGSSVHLPKK